MKSATHVSGVVLIFIWASGPAKATPVLLASLDESSGVTGSPVAEPVMRFELSYLTPDDPTVALSTALNWEVGDQGFVDFTAQNTAQFYNFAALATDGQNQVIELVALFAEGGGGQGFMEPQVYGRDTDQGEPPDLFGNELELVRLIVHDLDITPSIEPPGGFTASYSVTYEFYGTAVPEPGLLLACTVGSLATLKRRRDWW